jgi:tetratricopeptide (TPR) repeat protein
MIKKASIIIAILTVVTLVILLVLQNSARVNFTLLLPQWKIEGINAGVLVIIAFSAGFLGASFLAAAYSLRGLWRELGLIKKDKRREDFIQMLSTARQASAVGNWEEAQAGWERVLKRDPENMIAKLEVARALRKTNQSNKSLELIEELRRETKDNSEVLIAAMELNEEMENLTAALDNAILLIKQQPSAKVLRKARDLAERLGRFEQAIDYHKQIPQLDNEDKYSDTLNKLELQMLLADKAITNDLIKKRDALKNFLASHPESSQGCYELAQAEQELGQHEDAAQSFFKAGKLSDCPGLWKKAIQVWLDSNNPAKALAAAKTACKSAEGKGRLYAELYLIRTLTSINMHDEAKQQLENFPKLADDLKLTVSPELAQQYLTLKGLVFCRLGLIKESTDIWKQLSELDFNLSRGSTHSMPTGTKSQPAPELSTP